MQTVPVSFALPPGADAALGGAPMPLPPIAALAPQPSGEPAAPPPPSFVTGLPTFDLEPPEVLARRAKVAEARSIIRGVIAAVQAANDAVHPILRALDAEHAECKADGFNTTEAFKFMESLTAPIARLTAPPAPEKAESRKQKADT